jgi:hypothetical protein
MRAELGDEGNDALSFYNQVSDIPVDTPLHRLEAVYTLAIGMGMVESSGEPGAGAPHDSANPNPDAETAEAGLFQTSFNSYESTKKAPALLQLTSQYGASDAPCHLSIFFEGTSGQISPPVGAGKGAAFQQMTKTCPAFATEYVMVMLRLDRGHYGTLKKHHAEYEKKCLAMFRGIESVVKCER